MLADPSRDWRTVDVTYEDPHVERVWTQWGDLRVNLHRIHVCEKPLFHPHPWPSAMVVCAGAYLMGVGHSEAGEEPREAARVCLERGSSYEMLDPHGWHWVKPLGPDPVAMTIMVTGKPWELPAGFPKHGKGHVHAELSAEARNGILDWFRIWQEHHAL